MLNYIFFVYATTIFKKLSNWYQVSEMLLEKQDWQSVYFNFYFKLKEIKMVRTFINRQGSERLFALFHGRSHGVMGSLELTLFLSLFLKF